MYREQQSENAGINKSAVVANSMIDGVNIILGIDIIDADGWVAVTRNTVKFIELGGDMMPTF